MKANKSIAITEDQLISAIKRAIVERKDKIESYRVIDNAGSSTAILSTELAMLSLVQHLFVEDDELGSNVWNEIKSLVL